MAESPAHRFGQIIGVLLEEVIEPILRKFCEERGLYLDVKGERTSVRTGKKLTWLDKYENLHDLDFVIEKDGSSEKHGRPLAFIEAAWRRYTKHSRNKAQEIQGAILPIRDRYELDQPFLGAILAGVFTRGALDQLRSVGFEVLYFPYESFVDAFKLISVDVHFDEKTPDRDFSRCIARIEAQPAKAMDKVKNALLAANDSAVREFFRALQKRLDRMIRVVSIVPMHGTEADFSSADEALKFIEE